MARVADTAASPGAALALARRFRRDRPPPLAEYALATASVALVVSVVVSSGDALATVAYTVGVVVPVGLGLHQIARGRDQRFAWLLLLSGALLALTSLSQLSDSASYSTGRLAIWVVEPLLVYLTLSFPTGRLTTRAQRRVAAATALTAAVLYVPTAFIAPFPEPSPWAMCGTDCPENAFAVAHWEAVNDGLRALREPLTVLLYGAAAVLVARRARSASPMLRAALAPVAAVALFRALAMPAWFISRAAGGESSFTDALGYAFLFSLPAITVAFGAGLVGERLFAAQSLERLAQLLTPHAAAGDIRKSMAQALEDPSLRIVYRLDDPEVRWIDESGWPTAAPEATDGLAVTEIKSEGRLVAAIVHDSELARDPALVRATTAYALTALENERLARRLRASVDEVHDSRARIVTAADDERRKIERDLHDGAQQRLVALRVKLALASERLARESPTEAARLHDLETEVDLTIDEVRSFARGIYPPLLAERGLSDALRAAARNSPIPTTVRASNLRRYPIQVESTVYFACLEALQNAAKHARDASRLTVTVSEHAELRFQVHDNGAGFDTAKVGLGGGLTNLRDRLAAIGGSLEVESAPRLGTTVTGKVPLR